MKGFGAPFDKLNDTLKKEFKPVAHAITANKMPQGLESAFASTLRIGFKGTREVFCVAGKAVVKYMTAISDSNAKRAMKQVSQFKKDLALGQAKKFADFNRDANQVYAATVGPQDALFLPAGWAFSERVTGQDCLGVRLTCVDRRDLALYEYFNDMMLSQSKANPTLQHVVSLLTLAEDD